MMILVNSHVITSLLCTLSCLVISVGAISKRAAVINYDNTAPNPTVYYVWDSTLDKSPIKDCLSKAMAQISNISCVRFVNTRGNNPPVDNGFIVFSKNIRDSSCNAYTGLFKAAPTQVSLGSKCGVVMEVCLHELLHALGFVHEHERVDNVDHVRHNQGSSKTPSQNNVLQLTPYDLSSVMHYGSTEHVKEGSKIQYFAKNKILEHSVGSNIRGSHRALSFRDELAINKLFQCAKTCDQNMKCQHGGFLQPNCTCKCSYGFSGRFCENLSFGKWFNIADCGKLTVAESGTGYINSPNYPSRYPRGVFCQWMIKGNHAYEKIRFRIESLDLEYESMMNLNERCQDELYIWPHGTDVVVQPLSCLPDDVSSYVGHSYETQYDWLLVEFRSNKWGQFNHTGFNISYRVIDPRPKLVKDLSSNTVILHSNRVIPNFDLEIPEEGVDCFQCEEHECDIHAPKMMTHCPRNFACARKLDAFGRVLWRGCLAASECSESMAQCQDYEYYGCKDCCTADHCNAGSITHLNNYFYLLFLVTLIGSTCSWL